jgi:hypothetical protein
MEAKKWMKWLSVIALVLLGAQLIFTAYRTITVAGSMISSNDIAFVILAIVVVMLSFNKK